VVDTSKVSCMGPESVSKRKEADTAVAEPTPKMSARTDTGAMAEQMQEQPLAPQVSADGRAAVGKAGEISIADTSQEPASPVQAFSPRAGACVNNSRIAWPVSRYVTWCN
jgi:hypothetical protein